jgi:AcrR family transcriptional regulator/DNA-binding MarR family transcriptional regulator
VTVAIVSTPRKVHAPAQRKRRGSQDGAPGRVAGIQRQRILTAMAEVCAQRGAPDVTVAHIVARSGVSRRTFYELFCDREECLLAALDQAVARATTAVLPAYDQPGRWRERIRAGLTAGLVFMDHEPGMARLLLVESLGAGPQALQRRTRIVRALIAAVDEGRREIRTGKQPPPLTAEGVVGAILAVLHTRLIERSKAPLSSLLPDLMAAIVLPYVGQSAAERELNKPNPIPLPSKPRPHGDPLDGLDMRLTYRTVRVLFTIAAHPQASNRQVASAAGIADQGQVSKLLARLQNLGLIRNQGQGQPKGGPNAWTLTPKGQEVERTIHVDSSSFVEA